MFIICHILRGTLTFYVLSTFLCLNAWEAFLPQSLWNTWLPWKKNLQAEKKHLIWARKRSMMIVLSWFSHPPGLNSCDTPLSTNSPCKLLESCAPSDHLILRWMCLHWRCVKGSCVSFRHWRVCIWRSLHMDRQISRIWCPLQVAEKVSPPRGGV